MIVQNRGYLYSIFLPLKSSCFDRINPLRGYAFVQLAVINMFYHVPKKKKMIKRDENTLNTLRRNSNLRVKGTLSTVRFHFRVFS